MTITNYASAVVVAAAAAYTVLHNIKLEDSMNLANNSDDKKAFLQFAAVEGKHYKNSDEMAKRYGHWKHTNEFIKSVRANKNSSF